MKIRFGTDGWRGVISRDFTFDNLRRVVAAIGAHLEREGSAHCGVAVGCDRRFLSNRYAAEAAGVLAARGIPVRLAPTYLPTPALSWAVRDQGLAGGVMITASHNPPEWNGVKFKEPFGGSARNAVCESIEALLADVPAGDRIPCWSVAEARRRGALEDLETWESYRRGIWRLVDRETVRRAGLRVAVDPMHGCGTPWLRILLEEAGCRVVEVRTEWNPGFGGVSPEPVEANLAGLMEVVGELGCALGLATDGDADRIAAVDEQGRYFSSQEVLAVLLRFLREEKGLSGDVIVAVSGTSMAGLLAERYGVDTVSTPIGFKHIGEAMLRRKVIIGGEESGGIGIPAHLPERDALLNALLLAEIVACSGRGLRSYLEEIFDQIGPFVYRRMDLDLDPETAPGIRERLAAIEGVERLAGRPVAETVKIDGIKLRRDDASWLLVRASGTEPVLRIYAEARSDGDVEALLKEGRRLAGL